LLLVVYKDILARGQERGPAQGTTDRRSRRQTAVPIRRTVAAGGRPLYRYDGPS